MKYFLKSAFFFISLLFKKRKADIIFYYPQHFNREDDGVNTYFSDMITTCETYEISYLIFEEPDFISSVKRKRNNIPFDCIFVIILFLRKLFTSEKNSIYKDHKIGSFINKLIFCRLKFKTVITISQSMISFFRGVNSDCKIFDVQHGIIYNNKQNYILKNIPHNNLLENNVHLLLNGKSYREILLNNDKSSYFESKTFVIGSDNYSCKVLHSKFNNNILVSLQFTKDHDSENNQLLFNNLEKIIASNDKTVNFYLKHHPRFNNEVNITKILKLNNVYMAPKDLNTCLHLCSLHATAYSSTTFNAALCGIPTILINPLHRFDYFALDFKYPIDYSVTDFKNDIVYQKSSKVLINWAKEYYSLYNEKEFLRSLR